MGSMSPRVVAPGKVVIWESEVVGLFAATLSRSRSAPPKRGALEDILR